MAIPFAPLSLSSFALAPITVALSVPVLAAKPVEFAREIRPILSDTCFKCHGVDAAKRKGGLRLDQKEEWFHPREEGTLVVPGKPQESLVFTRITHSSHVAAPSTGKRAPDNNHIGNITTLITAW